MNVLKKTQKILLICIAALLLLFVLAFYLISARFAGTFYPGTVFAGLNVAGCSAQQAADAVAAASANCTVTLKDTDGRTAAVIPVSEWLDRDSILASAEEALTAQHSGQSIVGWMFYGTSSWPAALMPAVNEDVILESLSRYMYAGESCQVDTQDAQLVLNRDFYSVTPEEAGFTVDTDACLRAAAIALPQYTELSNYIVLGNNIFAEPAVTSESRIMQLKEKAIRDYLDLTITYDFGNGNVITLTPENIYSLLDISQTDTRVVCRPNREKVYALSDRLVSEYADDGVYAKFRGVGESRELIYYRVGDTGWKLDRPSMAKTLYNSLLNRENAVIVPDYDYTWYWKDYYWYYNVKDTYIEISMDNQYLWYFLDGELVLETPVVTGCLATKDNTRAGCFRLTYRVEDVFLQGPTWYDHVDFWMPFDGQIGMHDSSWRDEYGGDIYLEDGSHGCVNTPWEAMSVIYNTFPDTGRIIVY